MQVARQPKGSEKDRERRRKLMASHFRGKS